MRDVTLHGKNAAGCGKGVQGGAISGDLAPSPLADLWPPIGAPGASGLAGRVRNALARADIASGSQLAERSSADLRLIPHFGLLMVKEAEQALRAAGYPGLNGDQLTGWEPGGFYARLRQEESERAALKEQQCAAWLKRGRQFTEHALYHWDDNDPAADLAMATECVDAACGYGDLAGEPPEESAVPGGKGYACPHVHGRDCGYRP